MLDYDILHFSWDNHKFLVSFNRVYDMNIPKHYWNITNFRATLGHKINHSFKDSKAKFGIAFHPRFGKVVTIIATKNITKHEEILIDYIPSIADKIRRKAILKYSWGITE